MAQYEDLTIDQGSDLVVELRILNSDGSKRDLTDHSAAAWMKQNYTDDSDAAIKFAATVVNPPTSGIVSLRLSNTQTDTLDHRRKYFYDVELQSLDSDSNITIERVLEGQALVTPSVTK